MRNKKKFYGLIAGVTLLALATPFIGASIAKADTLHRHLVAWYDFNDGTLTNSKGESLAAPIVKGLGNYNGEVKYDANRDENIAGKSLRLDGNYGVKLNTKNLGENYSVSLWVKPEKKVPVNTPVVFVGYHDPELWYSVSGNDDKNRLKFWYNNGADFKWVTKTYADYDAAQWHHIVLTADGKENKAYFDGKLLSTDQFLEVMNGENQDIILGANNWDSCYSGLIDDVMVYDRTISAEEVNRLFTDDIKPVESADKDIEKNLVSSYDFENGIGDAKAIVKGMGAYNGEITYVDGINGKAVDFNDFGLDLGNKINGTDFTITFSVCPDKSQADNQVLMLLGYHNKEHWLALSGDGADQEYKLWGRTDGVKTIGNAKPMSWTTVGNPTVPNGVWSQVALVGTDGNITMYVDGEKVVSGISNNPLGSVNDSILFGANNWDACFDGKVDDIKIYNKAMSEGTVEDIAEDFKVSRVQRSLELACSFDAIGGNNKEAGQIRYDLTLPTSLLGSNITWKSSDESVISNKGVVTIDDKKHDITLTADVKVDGVKGHVELKFVVDALDKTELNALIEKALSYDLTYMTAESSDRLLAAIEEGKAAESFEEIDNAVLHIESSIKALEPSDEFEDPFDVIPEMEATLTMKPGEAKTLFVLPDAISKMVKVEYTSNDEAVSFEDGKATAKAVGKAIVTAKVTALSDDFTMEYSTAVDVANNEQPAPSNPGTSGGGSGNGGSASGGSNSVSGGGSSSGSGSSAGAAAGTTTPVVAGNTGAQAQIPDAQVPAAGGSQSTKPKNDKVDTKTEDSDETIVEDEVVDETSDDVVDESEEDTEDTTSETTILEEQTPEAGQSSGTSPIVIIIAALAIAGVAILAILVKLGILKL